MDKINAAFIFFTRFPVWKIADPPRRAYEDVVTFWPLVGWITGGITALLIYLLSGITPWTVAVVTGISIRLLITGALHEDGLADFCDGFGCGGDKTRILGIMKDSHIGTYGVIGLILYFLLNVAILSSLPVTVAVWGFFAADSFSKFLASQITNFLPYARPEGAKNGITYSRMSFGKLCICSIAGNIPLLVSSYFIGWKLVAATILPFISLCSVMHLMRKKIGGYTGDCCGATDLICETSFLIAVSVIYTVS